jgi:hypothetical protein
MDRRTAKLINCLLERVKKLEFNSNNNSNNIGLIKDNLGYKLTDNSKNKSAYHGKIGDNALDLSIQDRANPPLPGYDPTNPDPNLESGPASGATGNYSTAMGYQTRASADGSNAMGFGTYAFGKTSTAMGNNTYASGDTSTAMGYKTTAHGNGSTAMGSGTKASKAYSTAMGYETTASGEISTAMGQSTKASGDASTAMGVYTKASGYASTTMGEGTEARKEGSTAIGKFNLTKDALFVIGNGNNDDPYNTKYSDAFKVSFNGDTTISGKKINIKNIPTSGSGLSLGDIWNDNGTLKIKQ